MFLDASRIINPSLLEAMCFFVCPLSLMFPGFSLSDLPGLLGRRGCPEEFWSPPIEVFFFQWSDLFGSPLLGP